MKLLFALFTLVAASPVAHANPDMRQIEQIVQELEQDYRLNIRLIPQRVDSEKLWLRDLKDLTNILDNNLYAPPGTIRYLNCDKLVCRGN